MPAANAPKSSQKSTISDKITELIDEITEQSKKEAEDRKLNKQVKWMMPPKGDWDGDMFKWNKMDKPFDSDKPNEDLKKVVKDPEDPGNAGDLINTMTQIEYLAMAERAFRARHTMTFPRGIAHATARQKGFSTEGGPFKLTVKKYLEDIQKMSAGSV